MLTGIESLIKYDQACEICHEVFARYFSEQGREIPKIVTNQENASHIIGQVDLATTVKDICASRMVTEGARESIYARLIEFLKVVSVATKN